LKRTALILQLGSIFFYLLSLSSCDEKPVAKKKEMWASVIDFLSPDSSYYSPMKNFPFPASLQFELPDTLFVNQNRPPIINDSNIIYYKRYDVNGETVCCKTDTLKVYSDTIHGKKYLFLIGEYIALFQSDSLTSHLRPRKNTPVIPLWGIKLNSPYPADKFLNKYEKLGMDFVKLREELDEASRQTWAENDSILVETIQFDDTNDRIITSVYKDMNDEEVKLFINYIQTNFPSAKYKETIQKDVEGRSMKMMWWSIDGFSITITQTSEKEYSFQATDYYDTLKLILNKQQHYTFRDDIKVY
jgi:hypothetical protein